MAWTDPTLWYWFFFLSEWAIRLAMLVVVPFRRTPATAKGWLLLIFFEPWVGLVLYLLIGRAKLTRGQRKQLAKLPQAMAGVVRRLTNDPNVFHPEVSPALSRAVTLAENLVLCQVAMSPAGRLRMVDIAATLTVAKSAITKTVDRLEERGLLRRERDPADRRAVYAALTPAGEVQHCLAERLGRDRAGVHRYATDAAALLDHQHRAAEFGRLNRRAASGGATADDDEVEPAHGRADWRSAGRRVYG